MCLRTNNTLYSCLSAHARPPSPPSPSCCPMWGLGGSFLQGTARQQGHHKTQACQGPQSAQAWQVAAADARGKPGALSLPYAWRLLSRAVMFQRRRPLKSVRGNSGRCISRNPLPSGASGAANPGHHGSKGPKRITEKRKPVWTPQTLTLSAGAATADALLRLWGRREADSAQGALVSLSAGAKLKATKRT